MTKLLSAKELLDVVRTAQADAQASGGGTKWPPRMAVGGRSGPRRRAVEQARERDAQNVGGSVRPRGGTVPVMPAVSVPPAAAPLPAPPPPRAPFGSRPPSEPPPPSGPARAGAPEVGLGGDAKLGGEVGLPPASAILAAMRAKGAGALPVPREPEPIPSPSQRVEAPPRPPSMPSIEAVETPPSSEGRRRARTHPEPSSMRPPLESFDESSPPSAARSLAALFPPPRASSPSVPDGTPSTPPSAPRAPQPTMPEAPVSLGRSVPPGQVRSDRRSSPPIAREEPEEPPPSSTVPLELPDLSLDVPAARPAETPPRAAAAAPREKTSPAAAFALGKLNPPREPVAASEPAPRAPASAPASPRLDVASWASSKPDWAPRSAALDAPVDDEVEEGPAPVALSTDETIVLLNYDAQASLEALSVRTGFSVFKVERIVERLMGQGVLEDLPSAPQAPPVAAKPRPAVRASDLPPKADEPPDSLEGPPTEVDPRRPAQGADEGPEFETAEGESADDEEAEEGATDEDDEEELPPESAAEPDEVDPAKEAELEANYRKLFETKLARLDTDERFKLAELGNGPELFALVFDKDPQVARALFDNPHFTVEHARFAAFHHPTSLGIDRLAHRNEFAKDPQVQRKLLRNPHTPELVVRRILAAKRLLDIYRVTGDRDVPDRQRMVARGTLRQKFTTADPEDRLQLLWNTEGRCLTLLSGCAIDSKTTALFCARPVVSLMMVQNFAKFGATPPGMLSHFLKQNLVRRQVPLRNMLLKHPNCPSDAKKMF